LLDEQHALSASINPISYRRNALEAPFLEEKPSDRQYRQAWVDHLRSIGMRLPGSEGVFLGASRRDRTPLKFTPKRRILILQTNLSFGFASTPLAE
jgi:hypothetical protein